MLSYKLEVVPSKKGGYLLQSLQQKLRKYQIQNSLTINSLFPDKSLVQRYLTSQFLQGPQANYQLVFIKIIIWSKNMEQLRNSEFLVYFGLYLIDYTKQQILQRPLIQKIDDHTNRLRDVLIHPNRQQVMLIYEHKLQKYVFYKNHRLKKDYEFKLIQLLNLKNILRSVNALYHPSGQFIIGLHYETRVNEENIKIIYNQVPYKLFPNNFTIIFGSVLDNVCLPQNHLNFYTRSAMAIDSNNGNFALITGAHEIICVLDTINLKVKKISLVQQIKGIPIPEDDEYSLEFEKSPMSLGFLNRPKDGYFILFQTSSKIIERFFPKNVQKLKDYFKFVENRASNIENKELKVMKCVQIHDIDSMACMRQVANEVIILKIDEKANKNVYLNKISTLKQESKSNRQQHYVEDIVYLKQKGQICLLYNYSVSCYNLLTKCASNQLVNINTCEEQCNKTQRNSFWDPIQMICKPCISCQCINKLESFNSYYNQCKINCSKITHAVNGSQYEDFQKCICHPPHTWFPDLQTCRFNCSSVEFHDPKADYSKLGPKQCKCLQQYHYLPKLDSTFHGQIGICSYICKDGTASRYVNNQVVCDCQQGFKWDFQQKKCIPPPIANGIPSWVIAIIITASVILFSIIGLFVWRKCKKNKLKRRELLKVSEIATDRQNQNSDKAQSNQQESAKSQIKLQSKMNACIQKCQKKDKQEHFSCKCKCGYNFHFHCIIQSIKNGQNQCPKCNKSLKAQDLSYVNNQQPYQINSEL